MAVHLKIKILPNFMKKEKEIKERVKNIKVERDQRNFSNATRNKYNQRIKELEWVLDE